MLDDLIAEYGAEVAEQQLPEGTQNADSVRGYLGCSCSFDRAGSFLSSSASNLRGLLTESDIQSGRIVPMLEAALAALAGEGKLPLTQHKHAA